MEKLTQKERETRTVLLHPHNIYLTLLLGSITILFLAFSIAYIYSRSDNNFTPIQLPFIFYLSTLVLVGSSYTMLLAKKAYLADDTEKYQQVLLYTIMLSLLFMIMQFFGWRDLLTSDVLMTTSTLSAYVWLISGLHFAHVIAGLPFLLLFYYTARKRMKEPVSVLVYFSDADKRMKLRLLTIYWHFLDILWIYLVLFFTINYLI